MSVENSLHWQLDVSFNEDRNRIRAESSGENAAVLRHVALNLLKKAINRKNMSIKKKRTLSAVSNKYLGEVLLGLA